MKVLKSFKGPSKGVELTTKIIKQLLRPGEWMPHNRNRFFLTADEMLRVRFGLEKFRHNEVYTS